jgi:hypothetical protein
MFWSETSQSLEIFASHNFLAINFAAILAFIITTTTVVVSLFSTTLLNNLLIIILLLSLLLLLKHTSACGNSDSVYVLIKDWSQNLKRKYNSKSFRYR